MAASSAAWQRISVLRAGRDAELGNLRRPQPHSPLANPALRVGVIREGLPIRPIRFITLGNFSCIKVRKWPTAMPGSRRWQADLILLVLIPGCSVIGDQQVDED
jgi:hypothetical protein